MPRAKEEERRQIEIRMWASLGVQWHAWRASGFSRVLAVLPWYKPEALSRVHVSMRQSVQRERAIYYAHSSTGAIPGCSFNFYDKIYIMLYDRGGGRHRQLAAVTFLCL